MGYCQYYRYGQSYQVFAKLDYYVACRIARNVARSQPVDKKRRPRNWLCCLATLRRWGRLPRLTQQRQVPVVPRTGVKVRWRAV
jgi:hypothetical protein